MMFEPSQVLRYDKALFLMALRKASMTINLADFGIDQLSQAEKLELARAIFRSVEQARVSPPISDELKAELEARLDRYEQNPDDVLTLEQVKAHLAKRSGS